MLSVSKAAAAAAPRTMAGEVLQEQTMTSIPANMGTAEAAALTEAEAWPCQIGKPSEE